MSRGRGRGRRGKSRGAGRGRFVEGGFLGDWRQKNRSTRYAGQREDDVGSVEGGFKSKFSRISYFSIGFHSCHFILPGGRAKNFPNDLQVVLPALPNRAAVFEDKTSSAEIPSCSRHRNKRKDQAYVKASPSFSGSDDNFDNDSSSVDSDLAEDYANNVGREVSIEALSSEMAMRSRSMKDLQIDEEFFLSDSDDDDETGDDDDASSDSDTIVQVGLGYESGDSSDDNDLVQSLEKEACLECLDVDDTEDLDIVKPNVLEPSFILDKSRKVKNSVDSAHRKKGVPGQKKKHKKELIAQKRRERALHRGVDLESMNLMFESMVVSNCDMLALQPMKQKDLTLVSKIAAVYRLKIGAHGSGKKRFPTVTRTRHTALPDALDNQHMLKLLGREVELPAKARKLSKSRRVARQARASLDLETMKQQRVTLKQKHRRNLVEKDGEMVTQGLNFVASGVIQPGEYDVDPVLETSVGVRNKEKRSGPIGSFEAHTKGFGSRMLAKMGFVEGSGLGRDGQGMTQPLLPKMRPKSLGLGAPT